MKRFFNILAVVSLLSSLTACEQTVCVDGQEPEGEEITLPAGNYITFHADVNTRAGLQTGNYITESFGIYGYQYDFAHDWSGQRAIAKPNVFWNLKDGNKVPLKLTYRNGMYNYIADDAPSGKTETGQVNWSNNRYAFWAYYPYEWDNTNYISIKDMDSEGMPFIEYTVDRGSASNGSITYGDTDNMYDIMTGGKSQVTAASSGNTVTFTMSHRLSAVDVSISNAYQHDYIDDSGTNVSESVDIIITDLKLTFENLKYDKAKFYLEQNKNIPALNTVLTAAPKKNEGDPTPDPDKMKAYYNLIGSNANIGESVEIEPTTDKKTNITSNADATMTFIPQETTDLKVTAEIKYYMVGVDSEKHIGHVRVDSDGNHIDINGNKTDDETKYVYDGIKDLTDLPSNGGVKGDDVITVTKTTDFKQALVEATRYYIVLNFTSEAVSINIITAEAWDDKVVEYEFM